MNRPNEMTALNILAEICHSNLKNSKKLTSYLVDNRGISREMIDKYKLGFFPQNLKKLTSFVSESLLLKLNIAETPYRSQFSDYFSLVFPIYSEYGDAMGISGRTLLSDIERRSIGIPKYKNSSYKKADILYGLKESVSSIIETQNAYVVEGYFDKIAMDSAGIKNAVAICGTAFSQKHFLKLTRYTDKITFILDSDDAGTKSMQRIYDKHINKGIKLRFLSVPEPFKDVDEFFRENSITEFEKRFKQIIPGAW
jgi:DNA primase